MISVLAFFECITAIIVIAITIPTSSSSLPLWISSVLLICIYYFLLILLRPTTVFATWDMMTQTQRRKRKSFLQEFWIWSNGLVSKIVLLKKISRKSWIFSVCISLLVFPLNLSSSRSFNWLWRIYAHCQKLILWSPSSTS